MRKTFIVVFALTLWSLQEGAPAFAQVSSGLRIEKEFLISPEILFLSDFNITKTGSTTPFFRIRLINDSRIKRNVILTFKIVAPKYSALPLISAKTRPFPLEPGKPISLTNIDIARGNIPGGGLQYFRYNKNAAKKLETAVLRSGRLPNSKYELILKLEDVSNPNSFDQLREQLAITNPTRVDLLGPGRFATLRECQPVYTTQPQFRWLSTARKFIFTVCEKLPTNTSPEDVMQNEPRARLIVERGKDFQGSPNLVYPAVGVWPLLPGKTYYWQVQAVVETLSGEVYIPSEIWCFTIPRVDDVNRQLINRSVRSALGRLLARGGFRKLLDPNGPLKGYQATGEIYLNGRKLSVTDLNKLLVKFMREGSEIVDITIE